MLKHSLRKRNIFLQIIIIIIGIIAPTYLLSYNITNQNTLIVVAGLFVLSLFFTYYPLYWITKINNELKYISTKAPYPNTIISIIFFAIAFEIFAIIINRFYSIDLTILSVINLIIILLWGFIYLFQLSQVLSNKINLNLSIVFFLLIFQPIGIIILQYFINKNNNQNKNEIENNNNIQSIKETINKETEKLKIKKISANEVLCKEYIEKYKNEFSREQIKQSLIENNYPINDVEEYLNKYY